MSRDRCQLCPETRHCQPDRTTGSDLRRRGGRLPFPMTMQIVPSVGSAGDKARSLARLLQRRLCSRSAAPAFRSYVPEYMKSVLLSYLGTHNQECPTREEPKP
jgi:hypothetical protein